MLKISKFEIEKSRKRYGRGSLVIIVLTVIVSVSIGYFSVLTGINSDSGIYSANVFVNDSSFTLSDNPDIYLRKNIIFVKNNDKSLAAADEMIKITKDKYRKMLEERYGELAHPVLVSVKYLEFNRYVNKSNQTVSKLIPKIEEVNRTATNTDTNKTPSTDTATNIGSKTQTDKLKMKISTTNYIPPEDIEAPSLVDRMVLAFLFVIPSYFIVQIFSSSLLEDKILGRLEVMLSAVRRRDIIFGKILPYFLLSTVSAVAVSVILGSYAAFLFVLPVIFLLFAAQSFVVMISRSYREATFLLLVTSLLITIYVFIPAIFSTAIPLSKISPITLLLAYLEGDAVEIQDAAISFGHLCVMALILVYLSMKSLNPDVAHSKSIVQKLIELSELSINRTYQAFIFAFISIPFAFMAELFAIMLIFILPQNLIIPTLILSVAVVEELIKGTIILSKPEISRAVATALGFFAGEKFLIITNVLQEYSLAFLGHYLLFPLALHMLTAIIFTLIIQKWDSGILYAFIVAMMIHAIYNYGVVMLLA